MITNMIIAALFILLTGLFVLEYAIKNAASGYEDEFGFHEGLDPQRAMRTGADLPSAIVGHTVRALSSGNHSKRVSKRVARAHVEAT